MPHQNEPTGIFGAISLMGGDIEEQIRTIMERGMVAHQPRLDDNHASRLIRFTSYDGIEGGPLSLVRQHGSAWFPGWLVASDSSPLETSIGQDHGWYASNRVLISMIVAMGLDAQKVDQAQKGIRSQGSVDPAWSAAAMRQTGVGWKGGGQIFLVLPGSGILYRHQYAQGLPADERTGFCHAMEEAMRRTGAWDPDETLWGTYLRLLVDWKSREGDSRRKVQYGHQEDVWTAVEQDVSGIVTGRLAMCPHCRVNIPGGGQIVSKPNPSTLSEDGTYFDCLACGGQTRLIDACGLTYLYQEDSSNLHVMNAFSSFVEHLLLYSWCGHYMRHMRKQSHEKQYEDEKSKAGSVFVMDGPLALFGATGRFARAFRDTIQKTVGAGATVFGIVKTGRVCDFVAGLPQDLSGEAASYFVIPDRVRYEMIETMNKPSFYGFGEMSYYGCDVVVKTQRGLSFVLSVAPPHLNPRWWKMESIPESLDTKSDVIHRALTTRSFYGNIMDKKHAELFDTQQQWLDYIRPLGDKKSPTAPLWRAISTLEHVESLMYRQSSIPQVFAHMLAGIQGKLMSSYLSGLNVERVEKIIPNNEKGLEPINDPNPRKPQV